MAAPLTMPQAPSAKAAAGSIVRTEDVAAGALGRVTLAVYRSTDGVSGNGTEVSGAFMVPRGNPPAGGWPVVSYAHGTTGLTPDCGPTTTPGTLGEVAPVQMLLDRGYAVALIDYQGLGIAAMNTGASAADPMHPYLEPRSSAYNLADAVRALRLVYPGKISNRWAAAGHSQGGQAAWAAAEFDTAYAPELRLVGAMTQAPAVNLRRLGVVENGTYSSGEDWLMPLLITGLSVSDRALNRWDFLRGEVRANLSTLISCNPADDARRQATTDSISASEVAPSSESARSELRNVVQAYSLPQRATAVPLYVMQGSDDPVVAAQSTTTAVEQACLLGTSVQYHILEGRDHNIGDDMSGYKWIDEVMSGHESVSNCSTA